MVNLNWVQKNFEISKNLDSDDDEEDYDPNAF